MSKFMLLLLMLFSGFDTWAADCPSGQGPHITTVPSWTDFGVANAAYSGATNAASCNAAIAAAAAGTYLNQLSPSICSAAHDDFGAETWPITQCTIPEPEPEPEPAPGTTITTCSGACTITHVLTVTGITGTVTAVVQPFTADMAQDYMSLWALFLAAAVGVLGVKAVYNRFRIDHER